CFAAGNGIHRKRLQRSVATSAQLGEKLIQTLCALSIAHIKRGSFYARVAHQYPRELKARVAGNTYHRNVIEISHFIKDSMRRCSDSRLLLFGVMMSTVSSPAMVPAISGNFAPSTAAASGCAPLGGVFNTSRFSAGRISSKNSPSARASGTSGVPSSDNTEDDLY